MVAVKSVKNAIKYADYAIGQFVKLAKKEGYYKDTIFVIAADHDVRVYGVNALEWGVLNLLYPLNPMLLPKYLAVC
jgi:arylsulfatase A-like enzyme